MSEKKKPGTPPPPADRRKKPHDPHVFHPEKYRGSGVISPASGAGHNHTPGAVPLSPETHEPGD